MKKRILYENEQWKISVDSRQYIIQNKKDHDWQSRYFYQLTAFLAFLPVFIKKEVVKNDLEKIEKERKGKI